MNPAQNSASNPAPPPSAPFPRPTQETAEQFAILLTAGVPSREAILYFAEGVEEKHLPAMHDAWLRSRLVKAALLAQQGKPWQDMTLEEKINFSLDKTYTEAAYYLYAHNYAELTGAERAKADTCRQLLEAKKAGTAGSENAVQRFWADVMSGKIRLGAGGPTPRPGERGDQALSKPTQTGYLTP